jgi:signal transduction histidine kinase
VELEVEARDRLRLTVSDDGFGARPCRDGHHHGLDSMHHLIRDQGGWLTVSRGRTGGTTVSATLPADGDAALEPPPEAEPAPQPVVAGDTITA